MNYLKPFLASTALAAILILIGCALRYLAHKGLIEQSISAEHIIGGAGAAMMLSCCMLTMLFIKPKEIKSNRFAKVRLFLLKHELKILFSFGPIIYLYACMDWEITQAFEHVYNQAARGYIQYDQLFFDATSVLCAYLMLKFIYEKSDSNKLVLTTKN